MVTVAYLFTVPPVPSSKFHRLQVQRLIQRLPNASQQHQIFSPGTRLSGNGCVSDASFVRHEMTCARLIITTLVETFQVPTYQYIIP